MHGFPSGARSRSRRSRESSPGRVKLPLLGPDQGQEGGEPGNIELLMIDAIERNLTKRDSGAGAGAGAKGASSPAEGQLLLASSSPFEQPAGHLALGSFKSGEGPDELRRSSFDTESNDLPKPTSYFRNQLAEPPKPRSQFLTQHRQSEVVNGAVPEKSILDCISLDLPQAEYMLDNDQHYRKTYAQCLELADVVMQVLNNADTVMKQDRYDTVFRTQTTIGVVLVGCTIESIVVGGPAYNSQMLSSGDEIIAVDAVSVTPETVSTKLIGCDIPGSAVHLLVRKPSTQEVLEVDLLRIHSQAIADRRTMFELFTQMKNEADRINDPVMMQLVEQSIAYWSKMLISDSEQQAMIISNHREMHEECGKAVQELLKNLSDINLLHSVELENEVLQIRKRRAEKIETQTQTEILQNQVRELEGLLSRHQSNDTAAQGEILNLNRTLGEMSARFSDTTEALQKREEESEYQQQKEQRFHREIVELQAAMNVVRKQFTSIAEQQDGQKARLLKLIAQRLMSRGKATAFGAWLQAVKDTNVMEMFKQLRICQYEHSTRLLRSAVSRLRSRAISRVFQTWSTRIQSSSLRRDLALSAFLNGRSGSADLFEVWQTWVRVAFHSRRSKKALSSKQTRRTALICLNSWMMHSQNLKRVRVKCIQIWQGGIAHRSFAGFCQATQHQRAMRIIAFRVIQRWTRQALTRALESWLSRHSELKRMKFVGGKAIRKWKNSAMEKGWQCWISFVQGSNRLRRTATKIIRFTSLGLKHNTFNTWHNRVNDVKAFHKVLFAQNERLLRLALQVTRRWSRMLSSMAFESWLEAMEVNKHEVPEHFVDGNVQRKLQSQDNYILSACWSFWTRNDWNKKRLRHNATRIVRRRDHRLLHSAFAKMGSDPKFLRQLFVRVSAVAKRWSRIGLYDAFSFLRMRSNGVRTMRNRIVERWCRQELETCFLLWAERTRNLVKSIETACLRQDTLRIVSGWQRWADLMNQRHNRSVHGLRLSQRTQRLLKYRFFDCWIEQCQAGRDNTTLPSSEDLGHQSEEVTGESLRQVPAKGILGHSRQTTLGMELDGDIVARVVFGGPAELASFEVGDRIVQVDGQPASLLELQKLIDRADIPGSLVSITRQSSPSGEVSTCTLKRISQELMACRSRIFQHITNLKGSSLLQANTDASSQARVDVGIVMSTFAKLLEIEAYSDSQQLESVDDPQEQVEDRLISMMMEIQSVVQKEDRTQSSNHEESRELSRGRSHAVDHARDPSRRSKEIASPDHRSIHADTSLPVPIQKFDLSEASDTFVRACSVDPPDSPATTALGGMINRAQLSLTSTDSRPQLVYYNRRKSMQRVLSSSSPPESREMSPERAPRPENDREALDHEREAPGGLQGHTSTSDLTYGNQEAASVQNSQSATADSAEKFPRRVSFAEL